MNYQAAYLRMFNRLTELQEQLERVEPNREGVYLVQLLKAIQLEGESVCVEEMSNE